LDALNLTKELNFYDHPKVLDKCTDCIFWKKEKDVKEIPEDKLSVLFATKAFKRVDAEFQKLIKTNPEVSDKHYNPVNNIKYDIHTNSEGRIIHILKMRVGHGCGAPIDEELNLVFIDGIKDSNYFGMIGVDSVFEMKNENELFFKVVHYPEVTIELLNDENKIENIFYFQVKTEGCGC